jgi:hypothetical protein
MVTVLVTVSAESIGQFGFQFRYRTNTKIVALVVHYIDLKCTCSNTPHDFIFFWKRLKMYPWTCAVWDCGSSSAIMAFAGYIGCHYLSLCPKYITSNLSKKWEHPHDTTTITLMSPSLSQAAPCQALSFLNRSR